MNNVETYRPPFTPGDRRPNAARAGGVVAAENRPVTTTTIAATRRVRYSLSADERTMHGHGDTRSESYPVRNVGQGVYVERVADRYTPRRVWAVDAPHPPSYMGLVSREGRRFGAHSIRTGTWATHPDTFTTVRDAALSISQ